MIALPQTVAAAPRTSTAWPEASAATAVWLFAVALIVYLMVVVGGATRLTGSGLSITEWKPIAGALPPMSAADWAEDFRRYQATSQYHLLNEGMSLGAFKVLFWWEWGHRLLGRTVGVAFLLPFAVLLALRRIPGRLVGRCALLFLLGGLQGLVGWWMVQSGLEGRVAVAPERLATHLGLALALFSGLIWTGLEALDGPAPASTSRERRWAIPAGLFAFGVYWQCLMGALVAGNQAGKIYNDWPLMGGRAIPDPYWEGGLWTTMIHGLAATQFNHRLLAYGLLALGAGLAIAIFRSGAAGRALRPWIVLSLALLAMQAALGIATLLMGDPLSLALAHQGNAAILLASAAALAWKARRATIPAPSR